MIGVIWGGFGLNKAHAQTDPSFLDSLKNSSLYDLVVPLGMLERNVARYQAITNPTAPAPRSCFNSANPVTFFDFDMEGCVAQVSYIFLWLAARFLWVAGWLFNATLAYSLYMGDFLKNVPIVDIGWKILRDVANMCFIFILLYVAINTILQANTSDAKKILMRVIIIAVLLNFSLFAAKVVIDASNILALQFYGKMIGAGGVSSDRDAYDKGISQTFIKNLGIENVYRAGGENTTPETTNAFTTSKNVIVITLGGALLIMVTAFVFLAGAIMFIIRTVTLIFLLILSPLAFLSMVLPKTEGYWKSWLSMLINQSFFAPLYLMFMYIVIAILTSGNFQNPAGQKINIASFLSGNPDSVGTLYVFIVLIALMLGSLLVAKSLGAIGGDFARNWAGKATFGASSWLGRQSAGRLAQKAAKSDFVGKMRNATFDIKNPKTYLAGLARTGARTVDGTASGSMDIRSSGLGSAAAGAVGGLGTASGEGGFKKMQDDDKKRKDEYKKIVTEAGKTKQLDDALKSGDNTKIQSALYNFSDSEYRELGSEMLTNEAVIRNSKPSQIAYVTEEKFDKLRVDQKEKISAMRQAPLKHAVEGTIDHTATGGTADIIARFNSLPDDAKAKLKTNSTYGTVWTPALDRMTSHPEDVAGIQGMISALPAVARTDLQKSLRRAHTKSELAKLSTEEKAKLDIEFITKPGNEELLRNLDADTLKAIADRKDLPPPEKDKIKKARQDMLVRDLEHANRDDAKELLKGMKASDLIKTISAKDSRGNTMDTNTTFANLLTQGQLKDLEDNELDPGIRTTIGALIRADMSARGNSYVTSPRGLQGGW